MKHPNIVLQTVLKSIVEKSKSGTRIEYDENQDRISLIIYNKDELPLVRSLWSIIDKSEEEVDYIQHQLYLSVIAELAALGLDIREKQIVELYNDKKYTT